MLPVRLFTLAAKVGSQRSCAEQSRGIVAEKGIPQFEFTLCPSCGLANRPDFNYCQRCNAELSGGTKVAWDVGAFRAEETSAVPEEEEDRTPRAFAQMAHRKGMWKQSFTGLAMIAP